MQNGKMTVASYEHKRKEKGEKAIVGTVLGMALSRFRITNFIGSDTLGRQLKWVLSPKKYRYVKNL